LDNLKEAKLSTFSKYDKEVPAHKKGLEAFLYGITDEMKQKYRISLLDTTLEVFFLYNKYLSLINYIYYLFFNYLINFDY
jgi:hypothetical protein